MNHALGLILSMTVVAVLAGCCAAIAAEDKTASPQSAKGKPEIILRPVDFNPFALTPSQVFDMVKDSVVVVKTLDANGKTITQGSGVLLPSGKIGTNCHVVENGARFQVGGGKHFVPATLWGGNEDKDICLLEARELAAKPVQLGQATRLKVGEPVYAVGAPQGLELSLSNGIVSQLRGGPPPFIQTTAAISPGSSGGGLFDAEGRLVGFTALYIEGGQSLNFAMPVEWVEEIQAGKKAAQGRTEGDWNKRALALESVQNWVGLRDWCQQWTRERPENSVAWLVFGSASYRLQRYSDAVDALHQSVRINPEHAGTWWVLGGAYNELRRYTEAVEAYRRAVRIDPEYRMAWWSLGRTYNELQRYTEAVEAYRRAVRIDPEYGLAWWGLGRAYKDLQRYSDAVDALRQTVRINPEIAATWWDLGGAYDKLQRFKEASDAYRQVIRINPQDTNAWVLLVIAYERSGDRIAALEAVQQLRRLDPAEADKLFDLIVPR